jgi:hypothetical protein
MRLLDGERRDPMAGDLIVSAGKGDFLTLKQTFDHAHRLGEPLDANSAGFEAQPGLVVFRFDAAGAEAELQPPVGQQVDRRGLARDQHRVPQIIVQHIRAEPQPSRRRGGGH